MGCCGNEGQYNGHLKIGQNGYHTPNKRSKKDGYRVDQQAGDGSPLETISTLHTMDCEPRLASVTHSEATEQAKARKNRTRSGRANGHAHSSSRATGTSRRNGEVILKQEGDGGNSSNARKRILKGVNRIVEEDVLRVASTGVNGHTPRGYAAEQCEEQDLIPGLTEDLALHCLARVPRSMYGQFFTVSRKFYEKLKKGDVYKTRQQLGIVEQWMYILSDGHQRVWRAFNPREITWRQLQSIPSDYTFEVSDKETLTAGTQLLVRGMDLQGYVVYIYDLVQDNWFKGPRMIHSRSLYASASCGIYGFVAGGTELGGNNNLRSAERYNSTLGAWELLPDLNRCRRLCSGFYMDGKFYVIGGKDGQEQLTCGEEYDPATGTWRLIPSMYFGNEQSNIPAQAAPPLVAVVNNQLYALDTAFNELKAYNKSRNEWKTLGAVPVRADFNSGWGIAFKAMEGELYVVGGGQDAPDHIEIWAWKPEPEERPVWRYVTMLGTFIYNCAVMTA